LRELPGLESRRTPTLEIGVLCFLESATMADVYVLYSNTIDKYYIGSAINAEDRLIEHLSDSYENSYTSKAKDWIIYVKITNLEYATAREIEVHIKKMKSKAYIKNLEQYPEMIQKLIQKFAGSSR
jgi:putative endonuclease